MCCAEMMAQQCVPVSHPKSTKCLSGSGTSAAETFLNIWGPSACCYQGSSMFPAMTLRISCTDSQCHSIGLCSLAQKISVDGTSDAAGGHAGRHRSCDQQ